MKTYCQHRCTRTHRSYRAAARCMWPRACWISGDGPYALLAHCDVLTITLWPTAGKAFSTYQWLAGFKCGHLCTGRHEVIKIELDA